VERVEITLATPGTSPPESFMSPDDAGALLTARSARRSTVASVVF
jgi:hypothetical protein